MNILRSRFKSASDIVRVVSRVRRADGSIDDRSDAVHGAVEVAGVDPSYCHRTHHNGPLTKPMDPFSNP